MTIELDDDLIGHGFGEYALPPEKFKTHVLHQREIEALQLALGVLGVLTGIAVAPVCPVVGFGLIVSSSVGLGFEGLRLKGLSRQTRPTNGLFPIHLEKGTAHLNRPSTASYVGFPTADSVESHKWKLNLIRSAEKSIVLSGCYCGGVAFDEMLDLIKKRMEEKSALQVTIVASKIFVTKENRKQIALLERQFKDRFECVIHPEYMPYLSPSTGKLIPTNTNHTKVLVVDGRYFMVGGTGVVSTWTRGDGTKKPDGPMENLNLATRLIGPVGFRDNDCVFYTSDPHGAGGRLHMEIVKLARHLSNEFDRPIHEVPIDCDTLCKEFEDVQEKAENLTITPYATGPERSDNRYLKDLLSEIDQASTSIQIDHMYFHPCKSLMRALKSAAERGVHITIITNKFGSKSPGIHQLYTDMSRYHARLLAKDSPPGSVEIHEYEVPHSTLHKKVVVIDDQVTFVGSANIGFKSLEGHWAYEMNLKIESPSFAALAQKGVEIDKSISSHVSDNRARVTSRTMTFIAGYQSLLKPFL